MDGRIDIYRKLCVRACVCVCVHACMRACEIDREREGGPFTRDDAFIGNFPLNKRYLLVRSHQWHIDLQRTNDMPPVRQLLMQEVGPRFLVRIASASPIER